MVTIRRRTTFNGDGEHTAFLIIGTGPFGLAMAAQAQELDVDHVVIGPPMSFWKRHMPAGMMLRSGCDWHLDPTGRDTIERFLATRGQTPSDVEPLSLNSYLEYAEWFQKMKSIRARPLHVTRLEESDGRFRAALDDGTAITADRVLLALGFAPFAHIPDELAALVPAERSSHSCDCVAPERFARQRVLIVGGRQSAFESAALLAEAGASAVHVCHRHETPAFVASDWSWVEPLLERIGDEPDWYRCLPDSDREALNARFWAEGRLKLEPWLGPRVHREEITIRPRTRVVGSEQTGTALCVRLDTGETVEVDHVLYATGYKVDLQRVPLLQGGNLLERIECRDGFPVLDNCLQTTLPGLFMTSLPATREFGLFFAFTAAVRASARIVGRAL
jgi:cation diffusion facilitator CzcD-associated flavoprotein CzcO